MAYFLFTGIDRTGAGDIRAAVRDDHRAHLRAPHDNCRFLSGGPLLDDPDGVMMGSLLIFEAVSRQDVERFVAADPYTAANLFARTEIHCLNWTVGAPLPPAL